MTTDSPIFYLLSTSSWRYHLLLLYFIRTVIAARPTGGTFFTSNHIQELPLANPRHEKKNITLHNTLLLPFLTLSIPAFTSHLLIIPSQICSHPTSGPKSRIFKSSLAVLTQHR